MAEHREKLVAMGQYLKAGQEKYRLQSELRNVRKTVESLQGIETEDTLDAQVRGLLDTATSLRQQYEDQRRDLDQAKSEISHYTHQSETHRKALISSTEAWLESLVSELSTQIQQAKKELRESYKRCSDLQTHLNQH